MRLIDEWGRFDQSIVDAAIAPVVPSSQRLCPWSGARFERQAYSFSYFVMYLLKVIKIDGNLTQFQHNFFTVLLRNCKIRYFCV